MNIKSLTSKLIGKDGKINKRKLKYGSFATGLTALFIAAVVLINVVATMLFDRFPITLDLTNDSIYSVSQETLDYLAGIEVAVDITVMATEDEFRSISEYAVQCAELLKRYEQHNPNISVSYKDLLSNPDFVANYAYDLEQGDIIVELANGEHNRVKVVSLMDILNVLDDYSAYVSQYVEYYGSAQAHYLFISNNAVSSSNAEQALTGAIMAVTDANPITVTVLTYTGANESDVSGLTDLLDKNGYVVDSVNIRTSEIPAETDMIIIPAPKIDYTTNETAKIETWLTNGGLLEKDMIYVASVEQPQTPNLDALLEKYGITVEYKAIMETNTNYYSTYPNYTFQGIITENHISDIANLALPIYAPDSRAISTRYGSEDGYYTNELLVGTSAGAVLKDMYTEDENWSAENATEKGSFASVVLAKYKALDQVTHISKYTDVLVVGSDLMLNGSLMSAAQYNNGDFFLNIINELTGKTEGITIISKKVSSSTFEITTSRIRVLTATFAGIIPVAVLAWGMVIWVRRRHK